MNHRGYLKVGKERLGKVTKLEGAELDALYEEVRRIRNQVNHKGLDSLEGYWLKTSRISVYFRRNNQVNHEEIVNYLTKALKGREFQDPSGVVHLQGNNVAILNIYDIHLDKLPREHQLTYSAENYLNQLKQIVISLIQEASQIYYIDTVVFPVGGDLFNTNGFNSATKKGTPQQVLFDHSVAFKLGTEFIVYIVDYLVSKGYKVELPVIYGNHDHDADFYLGALLEVYYKNSSMVKVNNNLVLRKYLSYGTTMFGFGHGDVEKSKVTILPMIMATEQPEMWAKTKHRVFYLGDIHHKQEIKFLRLKDYPGCTVSFLRSVGVEDQWSHDNMFLGTPRTLELHVYNNERGNVCNLMRNL